MASPSPLIGTHDLKKKAVHGLAWYGASRFLIQVCSWVMTIAVARVLAPRDYGLVGMATVYVGLVDYLNELGFGASIVQRKELSEEDLHTLFWLASGLSLLVYGATWLMAPLVAAFYNQPAVTPVLRLLAVVFLLTNARLVPWNLLTRAVDFKRRSVAEVSGNVAGGVTTLVLAYRGEGAQALVIGTLVREAYITAQVYILTKWRPQCRFVGASLRHTFSFSMNISAARIAWYFSEISDRLIVGKFLGDQALGLYSMALRLTTELGGRAISIVNQVGFPVYSRLQDEPERLRRYVLSSIQLICMVTFPLLAGLSLVGGDAVPLLLKAKWVSMVPALQIMGWVEMIIIIHAMTTPAVVALGRSSQVFKFNLLMLATMPASFLVGARFGLQGVCRAWLFVFPLLALFWMTLARRYIGFEWRALWAALLPSVASTAMMVGGLLFAKQLLPPTLSPGSRLAFLVALGTSVYGGCLFGLFSKAMRNVVELVRQGGLGRKS